MYSSGLLSTLSCGCQILKDYTTIDCRPTKRMCQSHLIEAMAGQRTEPKKEVVMYEKLRKLDELALELKLLTTEMREKQQRIAEILVALNTTAAQGD